MPPRTAPSCLCVMVHSPEPFAFQVHHVVPKSWKGPDVVANRVTICGTCHDNVHHALDEAVRIAYGKGGNGTLTPVQIAALIKPYTPYAGVLITRAIAEAGPTIPKIYTLTPGEHSHE